MSRLGVGGLPVQSLVREFTEETLGTWSRIVRERFWSGVWCRRLILSPKSRMPFASVWRGLATAFHAQGLNRPWASEKSSAGSEQCITLPPNPNSNWLIKRKPNAGLRFVLLAHTKFLPLDAGGARELQECFQPSREPAKHRMTAS